MHMTDVTITTGRVVVSEFEAFSAAPRVLGEYVGVELFVNRSSHTTTGIDVGRRGVRFLSSASTVVIFTK